MAKSEFYDIVDMENIIVSIPNSSHFSLGTSPYYAHQHGLAIDVYHNLSLENYHVFSPVSGKVIKTKTLIAPKPKFNDGIDKEYLTLICNSHNPEIMFKILHVKPNIREGEQIEKGDLIGSTIRNGYFAYWSSPHLHLEIRPYNDAIRARGGKSFSLLLHDNKSTIKSSKRNRLTQIPIKIHKAFPEFLLANLPEDLYYKINPFFGVKININSLNCILDGGIPQYENGIVVFPHEYLLTSSNSIYFNNYKIGTLGDVRGKFGFFKFDRIKFLLNNEEIRGLSLYLANFLPLLKIIPYKKSEFPIKSNSIQTLSIIPNVV
jgi:hypothetical protein